MAKLFSEVFLAHTGKSSDKWEQYLSVYDAELAWLAESGEPVSLLEIGVQNGGSLEIWKDFLPEGSSIVGLDIDPAVAGLVFEPPIEVHIVDAAQSQLVDTALGDRLFDVVIDDGSHLGADVIAAFRHLFPRVKPGGKYIIEDLHASYMASLGSSLGHPSSSIEWLKTLVDAIHFQHIEGADSGTENLAEMEYLGGRLARISFFDSIAVIELLDEDRGAQRYRRILTGRQDGVVSLPMQIKHHTPRMGQLALSTSAAGALDGSLTQLLLDAKDEHERLERTADLLSQEKAGLEAARDQMQAQAQRVASDLEQAQLRIDELQAALSEKEERILVLEGTHQNDLAP